MDVFPLSLSPGPPIFLDNLLLPAPAIVFGPGLGVKNHSTNLPKEGGEGVERRSPKIMAASES